MMQYGLIGEKLGHSYSKLIHNEIGSYSYELCEVPRDALDDFLAKREFKAINVTIPYKQSVMKSLYHTDPAALEIGAVNTVVNHDGKLYGYNTDFLGLKSLIESSGYSLEGKRVLILGDGGTSRTARAVAKALDAGSVTVASRHPDDSTVSYEDSRKENVQVVINTTPCGMFPSTDENPIDIDDYPSLEAVFDVIYNPGRTLLVQKAQKKGLVARGGLYMLVKQAVCASEYFLDTHYEKGLTDRIYSKLEGMRRNIVLIGMPSSGKTTTGRFLSKKLSMPFHDVDWEIERKIGLAPSEIIRMNGEKVFRDIESDVCRELSKLTGAVISTGGGSILRPENVENLKKNGILVFLDRDPEKLVPTSDRPLSSDPERLKALYERRYPIYCDVCDIRVVSEKTVAKTAEKVIKELT